MAKRDRNHPAIIVNSLCNELECVNTPETGIAFVAASKAADSTRPTSANSNKVDNLYLVLDVQVIFFLRCLHLCDTIALDFMCFYSSGSFAWK